MKPQDLELVIELAKEVENTDPIDWGMLSVDENSAYRLIASSMLDYFLSLDDDQRELAMMATTVKLAVENFVLNLKLQNVNSK